MNKATNFLLPKELETFRLEIEATLLSTIIIQPYRCLTTLIESKFAGEPYLPYFQTYPKDITGEPMKLLAQINFAEIPSLQDFPSTGLLQFFISANIFDMTANYHEDIFQQFYKVRFYPTVNESVASSQQELFSKSATLDWFPIRQELALQFQLAQEPISVLDYQARSFLPSLLSSQDDDVQEIYLQHFLGAGAKIGGYAYYLNADIRQESKLLQRYNVLLLQIDSNDALGIMWANCGVGKFFINREKLLQKDFSDVLFQWENY
ncbi:YwqG family protein [Lysinibacillus cavernae]|uniref:YwqG family protein n=1 Tax=Lysinibacillus cavernae TaxID=2666135 RepID=UPI0018C3494D|nr:YwqG family protein [Lysinibacillus cavernae]